MFGFFIVKTKMSTAWHLPNHLDPTGLDIVIVAVAQW